MSKRSATAQQLGFDAILTEADETNQPIVEQQRLAVTQAKAAIDDAKERARLAHLPATMDEGLPYFERLLERFNTAILADDEKSVVAIMDEADDLALKLNGFDGGIIANEDSAGNVLTRLTAAPTGSVPAWGRAGQFEVEYRACRIMVKQDGIFGIGGPGFGIHAIDWDKPFPSETGYRSFVCNFARGFSVDQSALHFIDAYVQGECKGKIGNISPENRMHHIGHGLFDTFEAVHPDHEDDDASGGYAIRRAAFIDWLRASPDLGEPRDKYLAFFDAENERREAAHRKWVKERHAHLLEFVAQAYAERRQRPQRGDYSSLNQSIDCIREIRKLRHENPELTP